MDKYQTLWTLLKGSIEKASANLEATSATPEQIKGGQAAFGAVFSLMEMMENL